MRFYTVLAALMIAAAPAAAQQKQALQSDVASAPTTEQVTPAEPKTESQAPSLYVSRDQIDAQLRAQQKTNSQMGQHDFLYVVAAVALGVIIAALLLD
jgi:hypothetical protein